MLNTIWFLILADVERVTSPTTTEGYGERDEDESSDDGDERDKRPVVTGTKRKAEVLSKESGKIGVTITTSPPNSQAKIPKLQSSIAKTVSSSHPTSANVSFSVNQIITLDSRLSYWPDPIRSFYDLYTHPLYFNRFLED